MRNFIFWIRFSAIDDATRLGWWILKWAIILAVLIGISIVSALIAKLFENRLSLIFLLDGILCFLIWHSFGLINFTSYYGELPKWAEIYGFILLGIMILLLLFIVLATWGTMLVVDGRMIGNFLLLPVVLLATWFVRITSIANN